MVEQNHTLAKAAGLIAQGLIKTTVDQVLTLLNAGSLGQAHALLRPTH